MRVRLSFGRRSFFALAFLFALVALLPLRLAADWLALDRAGVAARDAAGSVWNGALRSTQYREIQLGDLLANLRALPLLAGRARVDLARGEGSDAAAARPDRFAGAVTVSRNASGVGDVTARFPLAAELAPLPITAIDLGDVSATFAGGQCASADGAVTIETSGAIAGFPLPTSMTGNARCEGSALLLPLAAPSGLERLDIRLTGGARYRATLSVRPVDPLVQARLAAAGFTGSGGTYSLEIDGRLG